MSREPVSWLCTSSRPPPPSRRGEAFRRQQIDGPQGPLRGAAALEPRALSAGQGGDGAEQGGAPHPRRHGHAPKISRGLRRFLAKRAYYGMNDTKKNKPQRGCGEGAAR